MQCKRRKLDDNSSYLSKEFDSSGDAVLRTEDGGKFKIKTNLLSQRCLFFKGLFSGYFGDGKDVILKGIDSKTLSCVLVYLYKGTISLNEANAIDILVASDYLLIAPLLQESRSFVLEEMTPSNCIPFFLTAWQIEGLSILNDCHRFIVIHFEEIVSLSEEIGSLPLEALKKILNEKSLNISDERTVWNVIVRWIKFDLPDRMEFVLELLKYISLEDADKPLVSDIIFHNLIKENNLFQELICGELQHTDHLENFQQIIGPKSSMTQSRIPTKVHFIIHYNIIYNSSGNKIYLTWDDKIDYWRKIASVHFSPDSLIQLDRFVYMFDTLNYTSLAFDMFEEKYLPMSPISKTRSFYSVVSVNGFIYVMGGKDEHFHNIKDIERFDPRTGNWQLVSRMVPMELSNAVALNGYIYAIGYDVTNQISRIQVYDPTSDKWSAITEQHQFKCVLFAIAYRDHLYVIGGNSFFCGPRRVVEYDPIKNTWIPMPNLPVAFFTPSAIVLNDVLIIYEDNLKRKLSGNKTPAYWDSKNRTWHIIQESSPLYMIHLLKFCTITDPNVVKCIIQRNRQQSKRCVKSSLA